MSVEPEPEPARRVGSLLRSAFPAPDALPDDDSARFLLQLYFAPFEPAVLAESPIVSATLQREAAPSVLAEPVEEPPFDKRGANAGKQIIRKPL